MVRDTGSSGVGSTTAGGGHDCPVCARLRAALSTLLLWQAWDEVQPADLANAAEIPVASVADHYPTIVACAVAALDQAATECFAACATAYPGSKNCGERFIAMVDAALRWISARPAMARLLLVIPHQAKEPQLLQRVHAFKLQIIGLFDRPASCSPAVSTYVEFVLGLLLQGAYQQLADGAEPNTLHQLARTLAALVDTPPPSLSRQSPRLTSLPWSE